MHTRFADLITAYLEQHLKGKASYSRQRYVAARWLLALQDVPTRAQIRERQQVCAQTPSQANTEFMLLRAAIRWGLYHERWEGHDPTIGIKKFKTKKRKRVTKMEEIKTLLAHFARAQTHTEIRDRALLGLMLFTGCRPGEARIATLHSITSYGSMGCWKKGITKNGEEYEVPVPAQYLIWLEAWKAIRPSARPNPYLFSGQGFLEPLTEHMVVHLWRDLRLRLGLEGLWNYDLRRSLATHMSNELKIDSAVIDAILGHENTSSLGHYLHVSFDAMTGPIQQYADWLYGVGAPSILNVTRPYEPSASPTRLSIHP